MTCLKKNSSLSTLLAKKLTSPLLKDDGPLLQTSTSYILSLMLGNMRNYMAHLLLAKSSNAQIFTAQMRQLSWKYSCNMSSNFSPLDLSPVSSKALDEYRIPYRQKTPGIPHGYCELWAWEKQVLQTAPKKVGVIDTRDYDPQVTDHWCLPLYVLWGQKHYLYRVLFYLLDPKNFIYRIRIEQSNLQISPPFCCLWNRWP